jgi:hypothetical protein
MEHLLQVPVSALGGGRAHMLGPDLVEMNDFIELSFRENLTIFLTQNYRGHPSFLMMPSALFYFDKLQSAAVKPVQEDCVLWCEKLRWIESLSDPIISPTEDNNPHLPTELRITKQFNWPIHFRGVVGNDASLAIESGFATDSWSNKKEALAVVEIVKSLVGKNTATQSIGVMSPFRGQVVLIRNLLRERNLGGINVGTIEDYQSVERDVVVLSLTRSDWNFVETDIARRIGVFGQPKRSNVALTRAINLFIVVRNEQLGS